MGQRVADLLPVILVIVGIAGAIAYFVWRALSNARLLWAEAPLHERRREWWVVVLMVLVGIVSVKRQASGSLTQRSDDNFGTDSDLVSRH